MEKINQKNLMRTMDKHPLFLATIIVLLFFAFKYLFYNLKLVYGPSTLIGAVIIDPLSSVSETILTTGVAGLIIFIFRNRLKSWFDGYNLSTTSHFIDLEDCLRLLTDQLGVFHGKVKSAHITTVSPILFTPEFVDYVVSQDINVEPEKNLQKKIRTNRKLEDYNRLFGEIIQADDGAYDKTTIGKTGVDLLDNATFKLVKQLYDFDSENPPGTTEIGFQKSLSEHAVFIFSECSRFPNSEPERFHFMMVVHFANQYKNICGYICFDEKIIAQNYEFIRFKKRDVDGEIVSNHISVPSISEWSSFKRQIKSFLIRE